MRSVSLRLSPNHDAAPPSQSAPLRLSLEYHFRTSCLPTSRDLAWSRRHRRIRRNGSSTRFSPSLSDALQPFIYSQFNVPPHQRSVADSIRSLYPGIFVHSISLGGASPAGDRNAGFFGHVESQVESVAYELAGVEELEGGFDAIGFSQGGQFLR